MNTEIQATKDRYTGTETPADIFVKQVYANLNDIKQSFFTPANLKLSIQSLISSLTG